MLTASQAAAEEAASATASASAVRAGQVINLATGANETQGAKVAVQAISSALASSCGTDADGGTAPLPSTNGVGDRAKPGVDCAKEGGGGVVEGLRGMSTGDLVTSFRRAQEERVALYKKFNGGLKDALRSGDYSGYPALCEYTEGGTSHRLEDSSQHYGL